MKAGESWEVANKYLMTTLSEKVPLRLPFGEFDMHIMHAVAPPFNSMRSNNNNHNNSGHNNSGGAPPASDSRPPFQNAHLSRPDCCRKWNLSACVEPCPNSRKHSCMWVACTDSSPHTGKGCKSNPDPRGRPSAPPGKMRGGHGHQRA